MTSFILPKGTTVKFGSVSTSLYSYLRNGIALEELLPTLLDSDQVDGVQEIKQGISVGELVAYKNACTKFCNQTSRVHEKYEIVLGQFVKMLQENIGAKPMMRELEDISTEVGLPIVLEIQLMEDCAVEADTHYVDIDNAERSWKLWRSVVLSKPDGIPADWIKSFYFPRLLEYKDVVISNNARLLEQTTDNALMVGGLMQAWHKDTPGDLLFAFKKQYGRINFSQSMSFDENALEKFFNLNAMLDPATRLLNQISIWQDITSLAKKQGISFQ